MRSGSTHNFSSLEWCHNSHTHPPIPGLTRKRSFVGIIAKRHGYTEGLCFQRCGLLMHDGTKTSIVMNSYFQTFSLSWKAYKLFTGSGSYNEFENLVSLNFTNSLANQIVLMKKATTKLIQISLNNSQNGFWNFLQIW